MRAKKINENYSSIHLNQMMVDVLIPSDMPNDSVWNTLWSLSTFKSEMGFDFIVEKSYINNWINDYVDHTETYRNSDIEWLEETVETMKSNYLYIKQI